MVPICPRFFANFGRGFQDADGIMQCVVRHRIQMAGCLSILSEQREKVREGGGGGGRGGELRSMDRQIATFFQPAWLM